MSLTATPSAANNTIRARCAKPARNDEDRSHDSSTSRSRGATSTLTVNGTTHDPVTRPRSKAISLPRHYRYLREALELLAAMAPTLAQAIDVARGKAFVILDGTLLRIDRVGMTGGRDRPYYSRKHKVHGLNVQVLADPAGRLIWVSPPLPGARHDMGAAREHGIIDALN